MVTKTELERMLQKQREEAQEREKNLHEAMERQQKQIDALLNTLSARTTDRSRAHLRSRLLPI